MGVTEKHGLYAVEAGSTVIGGIKKLQLPANLETIGEPTSGELYARFLAVAKQEPRARFTTISLKTALDACALLGSSIAGMSGGLKFYCYKHAEGGTRASGSNHRKFTAVEGLLYPQRLSCAHRADAELDYEAAITWDGSVDALQFAESSAVPAAVAETGRFTLGPCTLGGITFAQVKNFSIEFGLMVEVESADSDVWPTFASVEEVKPILKLTGIDSKWASAAKVPLLGLVCTHANTTIYLRKRLAGSSFVANGTAEHIKFTAAGLAHVEDIWNADGSKAGEVSLALPLSFDGTNLPLTINTASAIS